MFDKHIINADAHDTALRKAGFLKALKHGTAEASLKHIFLHRNQKGRPAGQVADEVFVEGFDKTTIYHRCMNVMFYQKGMSLVPWTLNDTDDIERSVMLGVDGIITDYPDRARRVVERLLR